MVGRAHTTLRGRLEIDHGSPGRIRFIITNEKDKIRAGVGESGEFLIIENTGWTRVPGNGIQYFIDTTKVGLDILLPEEEDAKVNS